MTIRLGILGAVHSHLSGKVQAIASGQVEGVEIAGAYETNPAVRARRTADPTYAGIQWVPRAEDLLADDSIQGVIIKAQIAYHRQQIRLLEKVACKAILVEGETIITVMPRYKKLYQE